MQLQERLAGLKLLFINELGFVTLSKTGAELLFRSRSTCPSDWTEVFGSQRSPTRSWTALRTVGLDQATIRISGD